MRRRVSNYFDGHCPEEYDRKIILALIAGAEENLHTGRLMNLQELCVMDVQELRDLRIVVIESSEVIRDGLRVAFAEAEGCQVVGMAAGGDEGLSLVLSQGPDVVLMNVTAPHQRGMGLLRTIRKLEHRPIVVVFATDDGAELKAACREAGATFYVLKWQLRDLIELLQLARKFL